MKKTTVILIILYFAFFAGAGYFLYHKYYAKLSQPEVSTKFSKKEEQNYIYYASGNNLYQLNPGVLTQSPQEVPTIRLQSTGKVARMEIDRSDRLFFYDTLTPQNDWEIWQVSLTDNVSSKIFSNQIAGLENFKNFRQPQVSPDNQKLAFLASHDNVDNIFIYQIKEKSLENLSDQVFQGKISSLSWSPDGEKIVLAGNEPSTNSLQSLDLNRKKDKLWEGVGQIQKVIWLPQTIVFSLQETKDNQLTVNLYSLENQTKKPLTDVAFPKIISDFQVSADKTYLVFEIEDTQTKKTDLYLEKSDGTNILQLTDDGQSLQAVFSPEGNKITYWLKGSGIYLMNINKTSNQKILNDEEGAIKILLWG